MITKLSISLPKALEDYARWRVRHGGYGSISEYFRELVRLDQRFEIGKQEKHAAVAPEPQPLASAARRDTFRNRYR
jgi:Arc/MetJ-type ribon-helix-helix transcriptional regulator